MSTGNTAPGQVSAVGSIESYFLTNQAYGTDFLVFYGSCVYGSKPTSDVDLFVATQDPGQYDTDGIIETVIAAHNREGRQLDEEVPFKNKILYSFEEIDAAVNLHQFHDSLGRLVIPKVVKSTEFLGGQNVKLRLAFNALTTPHRACATDTAAYDRYRSTAEINVYRLACAILGGLSVDALTHEEVYRALVVGPEGEVGEDYLGYKVSNQAVDEYLHVLLAQSVPGVA